MRIKPGTSRSPSERLNSYDHGFVLFDYILYKSNTFFLYITSLLLRGIVFKMDLPILFVFANQYRGSKYPKVYDNVF